jgi:hypothetical protein
MTVPLLGRVAQNRKNRAVGEPVAEALGPPASRPYCVPPADAVVLDSILRARRPRSQDFAKLAFQAHSPISRTD